MTPASTITPVGTPIPRPSLSGKPGGPCLAGVLAVVFSFGADVVVLVSPTRLETIGEAAAVERVLMDVVVGKLEVASGSKIMLGEIPMVVNGKLRL